VVARVAVIPGDGIGKEVVPEGVRVLEHLAGQAGLALDVRWLDLGADRYLRDGSTLPDDVFATLRDDTDAILVGALGDPRVKDGRHAREILLGLRTRLDLYINFRPIRLLDARRCPLKGRSEEDVDLVVFRENTEGLYTGIGGQFKRDTPDEVAIEAEINSRKGVERIIRAAFAYAATNGKRRVCMSDKSNAMRHGHDLWQRVFREVAREYPSVEASHLYVDVLAMEMVRDPRRFEVVVTNNLFGDIVTDLGAVLQGGLGLAASANLNPGKVSLFEPVHGSAPDIAGKGVANPIGTILTVGMLLSHLGHPELEGRVQDAVRAALLADQVTPDLGGTLGTRDVTDAVLAALGG
jgi:3-isopropylmalate dehydrogenase